VTGQLVSKGIPLTDSSRDGAHTNIFVGEFVGETHALGLMLDRFAVDDSVLELLNDRLVDRVTLTLR
jgi:hypothetical protein